MERWEIVEGMEVDEVERGGGVVVVRSVGGGGGRTRGSGARGSWSKDSVCKSVKGIDVRSG